MKRCVCQRTQASIVGIEVEGELGVKASQVVENRRGGKLWLFSVSEPSLYTFKQSISIALHTHCRSSRYAKGIALFRGGSGSGWRNVISQK